MAPLNVGDDYLWQLEVEAFRTLNCKQGASTKMSYAKPGFAGSSSCRAPSQLSNHRARAQAQAWTTKYEAWWKENSSDHYAQRHAHHMYPGPSFDQTTVFKLPSSLRVASPIEKRSLATSGFSGARRLGLDSKKGKTLDGGG
ncbi:hypothetical protein CVT25_009313 [Psilocybe cyanescens]|uniref:Uncharacterized protein n=1 Tax=Psilocybe cyanescens TaxID=93625 RepID=A0A409XDU7_PSICY|nr:hypothetical protein CVT25_009313 [Psilocybe cyanescens]